MNRNLMNAATKAAQVKALLIAMENAIAKVEVMHSSIDNLDVAVNLLYLAEDVMSELNADIEKLQGDEKVVDVIHALRK